MRSVVSLGLLALLGGCASIPQAQLRRPDGPPLQMLLEGLGAPTYEVRLEGGYMRRFFADNDRKSLVRTWRADFDEKGRLVELVPATTAAEFADLTRGIWRKQDVLARFGLPYRSEDSGNGEGSSFYYLHKLYAVRPAYVVLRFDGQGVLGKVEVQRIEAPASTRNRGDTP